MYLERQKQLAGHVRNFLKSKYCLDLPTIVIDAPPKVEMGEFAMPFPFELAKRLRKAPRKVAEEVVAEMPVPDGFVLMRSGYLDSMQAGGVDAELAALKAARSQKALPGVPPKQLAAPEQ